MKKTFVLPIRSEPETTTEDDDCKDRFVSIDLSTPQEEKRHVHTPQSNGSDASLGEREVEEERITENVLPEKEEVIEEAKKPRRSLSSLWFSRSQSGDRQSEKQKEKQKEKNSDSESFRSRSKTLESQKADAKPKGRSHSVDRKVT